ncbi:MAG: ATP-grasp protein [Candidatus Hydrogenedentes bacterium]|nr:ATP-grasp protein [Candidatus Hydrogenedentota bacterium]
MTRALSEAGSAPILLDTAAFPASTMLSFQDGELFLGRRAIPQPRAVYVRGLASHPFTPGFEADLDARPRGLIAQCEEKRALLESVLLTLERRGARLVNGIEANEQHSRKPYQLNLLRERGLPVPEWLATNDPKAVRRFVRRVGRAVYKPLAGGATVREVLAEDLTDDRLAALTLAPVLFQAYVPGVSVRAYVVGRRVVAAAEIHSPELDYRRGKEEVVPARLTAEERWAVLAAARVCGMAFAGVDLIRGDAGFHILECNPSPMFAVFEDKTGLCVAEPLASLLRTM